VRKTVAGLSVVSNTSITDLENLPLYELFEYNQIYADMLKKKS
jgi:hypothetical protein